MHLALRPAVAGFAVACTVGGIAQVDTGGTRGKTVGGGGAGGPFADNDGARAGVAHTMPNAVEIEAVYCWWVLRGKQVHM